MLNLSSSYLLQPGTSQFLSVSPPVSSIMPVNLAPQPSLTYASQPILQPMAQPLVSSLVQPVAQPLVSSLVQPVAQPLVQPIPQPVVSPMVIPPQPAPQVISPALVSSSMGSLAPSITYDKFIPPTPVPQSLANDMPQPIYQFYRQVPTTSVQAAPAYSTISAPVQNLSYSVGAPQYRTFSWM